MTATPATDAIATRNPAILIVAIALVLPGVVLSVALAGIGGLMLVGLATDYIVSRIRGRRRSVPRLPALAQLLAAAAIAAAFGGVIALGAWFI